MPREERLDDSMSSLQSLEEVTGYKLETQNDRVIMNPEDQLIELIFSLREMEKCHIYKLIG